MDRKFLLSLIELMINLDNNEKKELNNLSDEDLEKRYNLYLLEKSDEML